LTKLVEGRSVTRKTQLHKIGGSGGILRSFNPEEEKEAVPFFKTPKKKNLACPKRKPRPEKSPLPAQREKPQPSAHTTKVSEASKKPQL
jgi:hypothetical protein